MSSWKVRSWASISLAASGLIWFQVLFSLDLFDCSLESKVDSCLPTHHCQGGRKKHLLLFPSSNSLAQLIITVCQLFGNSFLNSTNRHNRGICHCARHRARCAELQSRHLLSWRRIRGNVRLEQGNSPALSLLCHGNTEVRKLWMPEALYRKAVDQFQIKNAQYHGAQGREKSDMAGILG